MIPISIFSQHDDNIWAKEPFFFNMQNYEHNPCLQYFDNGMALLCTTYYGHAEVHTIKLIHWFKNFLLFIFIYYSRRYTENVIFYKMFVFSVHTVVCTYYDLPQSEGGICARTNIKYTKSWYKFCVVSHTL